jgi:hypothetical protein
MASSELSEYYKCAVCKMVVQNPKECTKCESWHCERCLEDVKKKKDKCPSCDQAPIETRRATRRAFEILQQVRFRCKLEECRDTFLYADFGKHSLKHGLTQDQV